MTFQEEIMSAARSTAKEQRENLFEKPRGDSGTRNQVILEFLKWLFFFSGVVGILGVWVAYDSFLGWIESLNPLWLRNAASIFSYEIISNLPFVTVFFSGTLILGCIFATLQKRTEVASRTRADEATNLLSELAVDLSESKEVLNDLSGVKNVFSDLSLDLNATKEKLLKEAVKKKQMNISLKEARDTISSLKKKISDLTREREKLKVRLKTFQREFNLSEIDGIGPKTIEKLKNAGIVRTSDLLKVAPEDIADKTGISPKLVTRWLEDAAKLSSG